MKPTTKTSIRSYWISCVADPPTMPEDALAAEKPSFNRGPDGRTPFGVPLYRSRMYAAQ